MLQCHVQVPTGGSRCLSCDWRDAFADTTLKEKRFRPVILNLHSFFYFVIWPGSIRLKPKLFPIFFYNFNWVPGWCHLGSRGVAIGAIGSLLVPLGRRGFPSGQWVNFWLNFEPFTCKTEVL
jgi:hypothetical protein